MMEREKTTKIGPVCRFGPGGDYISTWPTDWADLARQFKGPISRIQNVINGIIDALRGSEDELIVDELPAETSEQTMLFADDWKIIRPAQKKTIHRIRTFHKTRNFNSSNQATLFDEHFKGAKTA
jgi:hypothetical protein